MKKRHFYLLAVIFLLVTIITAVMQSVSIFKGQAVPSSSSGQPDSSGGSTPKSESQSSVATNPNVVQTIGVKGGKPVKKVTIVDPSFPVVLTQDVTYLISIPAYADNKNIVGSFDDMFADPVAYYGYAYPDSSASLERTIKRTSPMLERFPGYFFVSQKVATFDTTSLQTLVNFSTEHNVEYGGTTNKNLLRSPMLFMLVILEESATLQLPAPSLTCGNGVRETTEACDDGNRVNVDACTNACTVAECGDGICAVFADEGRNCDIERGLCTGVIFCPQDCIPDYPYSGNPVCGNGRVEHDEQCDDANFISTDGCDSSCRDTGLAVCGNKIVETTEQCDDGNLVSTDGCDSNCNFSECICPPNTDCVCIASSSSSN